MHTDLSQGTYLFQGNTLVIPGDVPDSNIYDPIPLETIASSIGTIETLKIPPLGKEREIRAGDLTPDMALPPGWRGILMRKAISLMAAEGTPMDGSGLAGRVFRAYHIIQWRRESVFCGSCGSRNGDTPKELARVCPVCSRHEYPRISPAIVVLVINKEEKALLAHNKNFTPGLYSLIAGFNEAGETLEATVAREIREEVGLEVGDIRYIASQPWPFPYSLMLGFAAQYADGAIKADGVEIEDARWFDRDHLPDLPGKGSVSRYLINHWIRGTL